MIEPNLIIERESHLPALVVGIFAGACGLAFWLWVASFFGLAGGCQ